MERGLRRKLPLYEDACGLSQVKIDKILSVTLYDAETKKPILTFDDPPLSACPLFDFCNCKTGTCRAVLPDDSCYWYRYFKALIRKREGEI